MFADPSPPPPVVRPVQDQASLLASLLASADRGDYAPLERMASALSDPSLTALADARLAAGRLDRRATALALARFYRTGDARTRTRAWACSIAAADAFAAGDYHSAAMFADRWVALLRVADADDELADAQQLQGVAAVLESQAGQRVVLRGPHSETVSRDAASLVRSTVRVNRMSVSAVLDTGANLSVVSSTHAARLGLRPLAGAGLMGSGSRDAVSVRMALARDLVIAGTRLRNVAFLILDDEQLKVPLPGYRIDMIIGFPVFRALRRVTFGNGVMTVDGSRRAGNAAGEMRAVGNDLHVQVTVNGVRTSLQLDTGAST